MNNREKIAWYRKKIEQTPVEIYTTDSWLTHLIGEISLDFFNQAFRHHASYNKRLKTTGGRYRLDNHQIELNPLILERLSSEVFIRVILHELCHYHLHIMKSGYRHCDAEFKHLLQQTGGLRYIPNLRYKNEYPYIYQCQSCNQKIYRFKKIATQKYRCRCNGVLRLNKRSFEQ